MRFFWLVVIQIILQVCCLIRLAQTDDLVWFLAIIGIGILSSVISIFIRS